jgi:hypothetical protein
MKNATPRFNPEVPQLSLQYRMASRLPRVIRRGFGLQLEGGVDLSPEADKRLEGAGKLFKTSKRLPVDGNRPNLKPLLGFLFRPGRSGVCGRQRPFADFNAECLFFYHRHRSILPDPL